MYPRSFLCEEAKIKQRTPLKKELCEIGEEPIWESRFTFFFSSLSFFNSCHCSPATTATNPDYYNYPDHFYYCVTKSSAIKGCHV